MLIGKSYARGASRIVSARRRHQCRRSARGLSIAPTQTRVAQAFYCDVLRGRQVWDAERAGSLSFIVHGTRIDVNTNPAAERAPLLLSVTDPQALAERCWDAGYSVRVGQGREPCDEAAEDAIVSVIDPFGRRIELVR